MVRALVIRTSCGSAGSRSTSSSSRITATGRADGSARLPHTPWRCGSAACCHGPPLRAPSSPLAAGSRHYDTAGVKLHRLRGRRPTRGVYIVDVQRFSVDPRIVGCQRLVSDRARAPRLPRGPRQNQHGTDHSPASTSARHRLNSQRSLVLRRGLSLEITCRSEGSQPASLWLPGMDHRDVSALADQLAQCTCQHLPWTDQRVIAIELGVGECDLAIDDMVRGAVHGACPVPVHIIARLHEWLDGYDAPVHRPGSTARLCEQTALRLALRAGADPAQQTAPTSISSCGA
jgi:hypothetical protein